MKGFRFYLAALLLVLLTASCTELRGTPVPTLYPTEYIPTVIALTVAAGQPTYYPSLDPTTAAALETIPTAATRVTASPTRTLALPSATPTPDSPTATRPTPTATRRPNLTPTITSTPGIPGATIQIAAPGPLSRVVSPLELSATVHTVPAGSFHIELWAEPLRSGGEARLLLREVHNFVANPLPFIYLVEELEYELNRVSELAELRILTYDQFDRPVAAASVELILLQIGDTQLNPPGDLMQPLALFEPRPNILIQGGLLIVSGMARPLGNQPLLFQLIAADGSVVGNRQLFITLDPSGDHFPFAIDVPYTVTSPTWARLILSESGIRIPGVRQLTSLEVLLSP